MKQKEEKMEKEKKANFFVGTRKFISTDDVSF
jgi:hypothetical protein